MLSTSRRNSSSELRLSALKTEAVERRDDICDEQDNVSAWSVASLVLVAVNTVRCIAGLHCLTEADFSHVAPHSCRWKAPLEAGFQELSHNGNRLSRRRVSGALADSPPRAPV